MKTPLRSSVIRLAYLNVGLRPILLPLLVKVAVRRWKDKAKMEEYLKSHPGSDPKNHELAGDEEVEDVVYHPATDEEIHRAKSEASKTTWAKPSLEEEAGEIKRTAEEFGLDPDKIMAAGKKAKLETLDEETWSKIENTDSFETDTVKKADRRAKKYNRDIARVFNGMGTELPAPIVLIRKGSPPYLIGGNTRLMASRALGHFPKILAIRM